MSVLDSLPDRPLTPAELTAFNHSDALEIAVDIGDVEEPEDEETDGLLLATEDWVKGLAYFEEGWRVVETVPLDEDDNERYGGMRTCESAIREALD